MPPGPLAHPGFRRLFLGRTISVTGDKVAPVALAFAVLGATGSAADLGYVLASRVVCMVVCLLAAGVWSDRLPRRLVLVGTDLVRVGTQGATAALVLADAAAIWQLVVLQGIAGAGQAFFRPASTGIVPSLVPEAALQQANAVLGLSENATTIAGPVIAGVLVAGVGAGWGLALDAASYLASALLLLSFELDERPRPAEPFLTELRAGWREFRGRRWVVAFVGEFSLYHLVAFAPFMILGPALARRDLGGASAWAAIMTAFGTGAVAGGGVTLRLRPARPLLVTAWLFLLPALPLAALALTTSLAVIAAAAALAGAAGSFTVAVWETSLQRRIPAHALSRVSSYDWLGSMAFLPLGYAAVGPLAAAVGARGLLLAAAAIQAASVPLLLAASGVRAEAACARSDQPASRSRRGDARRRPASRSAASTARSRWDDAR